MRNSGLVLDLKILELPRSWLCQAGIKGRSWLNMTKPWASKASSLVAWYAKDHGKPFSFRPGVCVLTNFFYGGTWNRKRSHATPRARSRSSFSHVFNYWFTDAYCSAHRSLLAFDPVAWHGSQPTKFEKSLSASLRPVPRSACRAEHMDANETFWAAWLSGIQSWPIEFLIRLDQAISRIPNWGLLWMLLLLFGTMM